MFSMGNTEPRLYSRILASAGMSCVVVTSTLTQLLLRDGTGPPLSNGNSLANDSPGAKRREPVPGADDGKRLEGMSEPRVGQGLHLGAQLQPSVPLGGTQQTCDAASTGYDLGDPRLEPASFSMGRVYLTPHVVFVRAVQLFDASVAEGQLPHPVDAAADARSQAQVGAGGGCVEAIRCKTVSAVEGGGGGRLSFWQKIVEWLWK